MTAPFLPYRRVRSGCSGCIQLKGHLWMLACAVRPYRGGRPAEWTMTVYLRWLRVELHDPDGVALGVLEPRGRPNANIGDAVHGLQPRKVVLLEYNAT